MSMFWCLSTVVSAKMFCMSSLVISTCLFLNILFVEWSCSRMWCFSAGSFDSTRCRKSVVLLSRCSGDRTFFTIIVSVYLLSCVFLWWVRSCLV